MFTNIVHNSVAETSNNNNNTGFASRRPLSAGCQRNYEEELLNMINSEFQINCCRRRSLNDIFQRIQQNKDLSNYIANDLSNLKRFVLYYKENFSFDPVDTNIVVWNTDKRLSVKGDIKELKRMERIVWTKRYDEETVKYDSVFDEIVIRFVLALFVRVKYSCLQLKLVETAVKQAFHEDVEVIDYLGRDVKKFLVKRDFLFYEHDDLLIFKGVRVANAVYALNEELREKTAEGIGDEDADRSMSITCLHKFFIDTYLPNIADDPRAELDGYKTSREFVTFVRSCDWVFSLSDDESRVASRRSLPAVPWKTPLDKDLLPVVNAFEQVHPKWTEFDWEPLDVDDELDEMIKPAAPDVSSRKSNERHPKSFSAPSSVIAASRFPIVAPHN